MRMYRDEALPGWELSGGNAQTIVTDQWLREHGFDSLEAGWSSVQEALEAGRYEMLTAHQIRQVGNYTDSTAVDVEVTMPGAER